jgi:ZIP family zinc transporter
MIYVSFVELFSYSRRLLSSTMGETAGALLNVISFFGGVLLIAVIDKLVPSYENPHEAHGMDDYRDSNKKLLRAGFLTAVIIFIHNLPEGMATFVSSIQRPSLGIAIAIAIAIHNIPEGISVSVPVYFATGSRTKAFMWSIVSGFAEPLGAIIAYIVLLPILNDTAFGILFGAIAGIMVFISMVELLPTSEEYGEHHLLIYGLVAGMVVMAFSLLTINL